MITTFSPDKPLLLDINVIKTFKDVLKIDLSNIQRLESAGEPRIF